MFDKTEPIANERPTINIWNPKYIPCETSEDKNLYAPCTLILRRLRLRSQVNTHPPGRSKSVPENTYITLDAREYLDINLPTKDRRDQAHSRPIPEISVNENIKTYSSQRKVDADNRPDIVTGTQRISHNGSIGCSHGLERDTPGSTQNTNVAPAVMPNPRL